MSTVLLACDGCGTKRQGLPGQSIGPLRLSLSKLGWKADTAEGVDLCPTCVLAQRRKAAGDSTGGAAS